MMNCCCFILRWAGGCWHKSEKHVQGIKRGHTNTVPTLHDCKYFCEFGPLGYCHAIDWSPSTSPSCFFMQSRKTKPAEAKFRNSTHYELDKRCDRKFYPQLYTVYYKQRLVDCLNRYLLMTLYKIRIELMYTLEKSQSNQVHSHNYLSTWGWNLPLHRPD